MDLSFKEKCISIALSISLGAFVPSAAFASQDEGDDGSGFRQEIALKDAADNAINLPLNEALSGTFATDEVFFGTTTKLFKVELPVEGDLTTALSVGYSGAVPESLTSEFTVDPKEKSMQFKNWSGTNGGTNETLHLQAGTYYLSVFSMSSALSAKTVDISVRADFQPAGGQPVDPEPSPVEIDISSAVIELGNTNFDYTGSEIEPEVTSVRLKGVTLSVDKDYEVSYSDNVNAGTAHCIITGIGEYSGSASKSFTIAPRYLTEAEISNIPDQKWTGSAIEPDVTVSLGGRELIAGTDYTLSYEDNVDPGSATVYANGNGNYRGTASKFFNIVDPPTLLKEGVLDTKSSKGADLFSEKWSIEIEEDILAKLLINNRCFLAEGKASPYLIELNNEEQNVSYVWSMDANLSHDYGWLALPAGKWTLSIISLTTGYHSVAVRYDTQQVPVNAVAEREHNDSIDEATPIDVGDRACGSIYNPIDADGKALVDFDYYKITIDSPQSIEFRLLGIGDAPLLFGLYDESGTLVERDDGTALVGKTSNSNNVGSFNTGLLPAGTYYLGIGTSDRSAWGEGYFLYVYNELPFTDVRPHWTYEGFQYDWYYDGVKFVYEKGLIKGYSGTTLFGVGDTLTRAQLATILYRNANPGVSLDSRPSNTTGMPDVKGGEWYTAGVNWAVENGVINGYADEQGNRFAFGPDDPVTFEQLITVLANCSAKSEDLPSAQESSKVLSSFNDGQSVSAWAQANMAWAVESGLVSGYDEPDGQYLRPGEEVARERVAVILMRAFQSGILK
ncbi:S-layer homology domain-containing protein [Ellagibacter isourolithinifaciens]|uniref:S-layer homology domain-containing protein n=1 Tax=Ellagibacter isourolithinifaciens TaxID=2137581 RepID=UPI0023F21A09|nr:S-layer homology domain-containing protein [Ellagibacter isourolithinifaciens]MDD5925774.1 S-layer homology domain-containing protein [Ellagibacter isourolithinifaciens]